MQKYGPTLGYEIQAADSTTPIYHAPGGLEGAETLAAKLLAARPDVDEVAIFVTRLTSSPRRFVGYVSRSRPRLPDRRHKS
jgi:hypothetical protein